ncbi:CoA-binding protein, partial [Mortierella sp. GBAus27b]
FAVVGASTNRAKFGNKVLRWYVENGYSNVVPVNPKEQSIESLACAPNLSSLPDSPAEYHVSIITPPSVTKSVLEEAHKNGIKKVWLQPDVESPEALDYANQVGLQVIAGGPCVLVDG